MVAILFDISKLETLKCSFIQTKAVLEIYKYCNKNNLYIYLNQEICELFDEMKCFNLKHHLLNENYSDDLKSSCYLISNLENYIKNNKITKIVIVSEKNLDKHINRLRQMFAKYNLSITNYIQNLNKKMIITILMLQKVLIFISMEVIENANCS